MLSRFGSFVVIFFATFVVADESSTQFESESSLNEEKWVFLGCTSWRSDRCSAILPSWVVSQFNQSSTYDQHLLRLFNYNGVRLRLFGFVNSERKITIFDSDRNCHSEINFYTPYPKCNAFQSLVGRSFECLPCKLSVSSLSLPSGPLSSLLLVIEKRPNVLLSRSCGAGIVKIGYSRAVSPAIDSILTSLEGSHRSYVVRTDDAKCEARDRALRLRRQLFICVADAEQTESTKPGFARELCSYSISIQPTAYSSDSDVPPFFTNMKRGGSSAGSGGGGAISISGHTINRSVLIGVIFPFTAFIAAACFVWCYRQKCGPTLMPSSRARRRVRPPRRPCTATNSRILTPVPNYTDCCPPPPSYDECMQSCRNPDVNHSSSTQTESVDTAEAVETPDSENTTVPLLSDTPQSQKSIGDDRMLDNVA